MDVTAELARHGAALALLEANAQRIGLPEMALAVTSNRRSDVPPTVLLELWVHSYAGTYRWRAQLVAARFYRLGKRYTRASLTQPEAVDLLTGQPAGPVTEQQKSDAAKGMEMLR